MSFSDYITKLNQTRNASFEYILDEKGESTYLEVYMDSSKGMKICFSKDFPLCLPDIFVNKTDEIRPHIEANGKICLFDIDSVLIDTNLPDQLLIECYDKAVSILNMKSNSKKYYSELLREADSYWVHNSLFIMTSDIDFRNKSFVETNMLTVSSIANGYKFFYLGETIEEAEILAEFFNNSICEKNINDCIIIRLKRGSSILPIKEKYSWLELRQYILKNTTGGIHKRFREHTKLKSKAVIESIIVLLPTTFGDIALGFLVFGSTNNWVSMDRMLGLSCRPLYIRRLDYAYLTNRGGAVDSLENKQVLLLGCGSVGGYIAENLCKSGIKVLDIMDKDSFSEENLYRHYLGADSLVNPNNRSSNKADLMKNRLESEFLDVEIDSLAFKERKVETLLSEPKRFGNYDLIISALGEPTINLEINRLLKENAINVPFICAFNEPYGIGGHSILTNNTKEGCLQCLYTDVSSSELCTFRPSLVAPGQYFKKNISGCGGAFVPYSALDSEQTAINTVRLAIDVLLGKETSNCVITWFGSADELKSQGFITSQYYDKNFEKVKMRLVIEENSRCPVCS